MRRSRPSSRARPTPFGPNSKGVDGRRQQWPGRRIPPGHVEIQRDDTTGRKGQISLRVARNCDHASGSRRRDRSHAPIVSPPATSARRSSPMASSSARAALNRGVKAPSRIREQECSLPVRTMIKTTPSNRLSPRFARVGGCARGARAQPHPHEFSTFLRRFAGSAGSTPALQTGLVVAHEACSSPIY